MTAAPQTDVSTSDLCDEHGGTLQSCTSQLRQFGARATFMGRITTIRCHEDNMLVKDVLSEQGEGRVLVVDGSGSLHCALLGDDMARRAVQNGWDGVIIHGAVRDAAALRGLDLGVKAMGTSPRRSGKAGTGQRDVVVGFGGAVFTPGDTVASDDDGVVVLTRRPG